MRRLVILALLFGGSAAFAQTDQAFPQQLPNQMRQQQQQVPEELRQLPQQITQSRSCGQVSGQADVTVEDTKDGMKFRKL